MNWARRGLLHFLALLLFASLLGVAFTTSASNAFSHPDKLKRWLHESNLYTNFISDAIDQSQKSVGNSQLASVSLGDAAVRQAAETAFSPQLIEHSVNTFLDSNYAWLDGKTNSPSFAVDLTAAKQSFAQQVGQYAETHLNTLPVCLPTQLAQIDMQNLDPLTIPCKPDGLNAHDEGVKVTREIASSSDFLSNPVITANTINPNAKSQSKPYYQKLPSAPKLYRVGVKLPWVFAALALLSMIGVFFLAQRKRLGLRRISIALGLAGFVLVATKFVADAGFNRLEHKLFNSSGVGQLQRSLTDFLHRVENQLVKVDLWFGVAFLVLAGIIVIVLLSTRGRRISLPKLAAQSSPDSASESQQTVADTPPKPEQPPRPKRPRLIQ